MTHVECPVCNYRLTLATVAEDQVSVCPLCGFCLEVPPPWDSQAVDHTALALIMRPGGAYSSFRQERRAAHLQYMRCGLIAVPIAAVSLYWAWTAQEMFNRLLGWGLFFLVASGGVVLLLAASLGARWEGRPSPVPLPSKPRRFFDQGRPICVLQELANASLVWVTVLIEVLWAVIFLVVAYAAWLAARAGEAGQLALLIVIGPLSSCLLLFHAARLVFYPLRVWLFPEGFARVRGGDATVQRWDRVEAVTVQAIGTYSGTHHALTVICANGNLVELGKGVADLDQRDLQRLADIFRAYSPLFLHAAEQALQKGSEVPFGPLQISPKGIFHLGKLIPWTEIADLQIEYGKLSILGKEQSLCQVLADTVPNIEVFQILAGRYITPVE